MKIQFFNVCLGRRSRAYVSVRYGREKVDFFFPRGNIGDRIRAKSLQEYLFARSSSIFVQGQDESGAERDEEKGKEREGGMEIGGGWREKEEDD